MKKIECEISGDALLMHSPKAMLEGDSSGKVKSRNAVVEYNPQDEAEKGAYRMKSGELYVPAEAIFGSMLRGASFMKVGKHALRPIFAGNVRIEPREIGLGTKEYDIDIRTVVLNRKARIVRARPMVKDWKIKFQIVYNEQIIPNPELIRNCLEDAGQRIGILDFRPSNGGSFGTFKIDKFKN